MINVYARGHGQETHNLSIDCRSCPNLLVLPRKYIQTFALAAISKRRPSPSSPVVTFRVRILGQGRAQQREAKPLASAFPIDFTMAYKQTRSCSSPSYNGSANAL